MNVTCTACQTVFRVDPAKVPVAGVRARCSVCSGVFWVRHAEPASAPEPALEPVIAPPPPPSPVGPMAGIATEPPPAAAVSDRPPPAPVAVAPPVVAAVARPAMAPPPPAVVSRPQGPAVAPPLHRPMPDAPVAAPSFERSAAGPVPPSFARPSQRPAPPAAPAAPSPSPVMAPASVAPAGAAPLVAPKKVRANPFLSQDPAAKARRLARALISDMVVYHPAKRREGLQNGSLRRLFDEEIRKSWEEFVDQVGKDMAESTPFFQEALNEILADGQPLFP